MPETDSDLALLTHAARLAGDEALRFWRKSPKFWDKGGSHGPVSEADLAVNALLDGVLRLARPDYGWLSEETPDSADRLGAGPVFVIDPIDGTRAFLDGQTQFAVALAVVRDGRVTAGVVHMPALDQIYAAAANGPALLNGAPMAPVAPQGTILTSRAVLQPEHWPGGVPDLRHAFRPSMAYRLCLVAEGAHDAMLTLRPAWEWDIAAASLIAERAGMRVTDRHGGTLRFNQAPPQAPGLLAARPDLHADLLARLSV